MEPPPEAAQNEQAFRGPPLHLLVFAYQNRLSGTVTIDTESGQRHQVYFHEGAPAKVLLADPVLTRDCIIGRMGSVPPEDLVGVPTVSGSLRESLDALWADKDFLLKGDVFTEEQIQSYCELRWEEVLKFEQAPHPIEFNMYYSV